MTRRRQGASAIAEDRVFHVPPPAEELPTRLQTMCDFANAKTPDYFVHPVLRS